MLTIGLLVEFLDDYGILESEQSPGPSRSDDDDVRLVDWTRLFPSRNRGGRGEEPWDLLGDGWEPTLPPEFMSDLDGTLSNDNVGSDVSDQRIPSVDWDVCGWYQSIHFHGLDWGIFIRQKCLYDLSLRIAPYVNVGRPIGSTYDLSKALIRAAFAVVFLHEQFHHKVESLGFRLHVVEGKSSYVPYRKSVYAPAFGTDDLLEEALATADAYRRLSHEPYKSSITSPIVDATRAYLRATIPLDPPGYRRALAYLKDPFFANAENTLQTQVHEGALSPKQAPHEWDAAPQMLHSLFRVTDHIWEIVPPGAPPLLNGSISPYPSVSSAQMMKILTRHQVVEVPRGGKGSHRKFKYPNGASVVLPDRQDLSPVEMRNLLAPLGLRLADLQDLI